MESRYLRPRILHENAFLNPLDLEQKHVESCEDPEENSHHSVVFNRSVAFSVIEMHVSHGIGALAVVCSRQVIVIQMICRILEVG